MKIAAITMVYNEGLLLSYFLRHYDYLDEIHVLYETDSTDDTLKILKQASNVIIKDCHAEGGFDDIYKVNSINNTLHHIKTDWVYVVDCDEFIFPPGESPEDFLSRQDRESYTVVRAGMFQVYRHRNDNDLDTSLPPIPQRVHGDSDLFSTVRGPNKDPNVNYVKPIVVKPSSEIRFQPGNHIVEGDMRVSPEFYLGAHWQMADPSIAIDRRIKNRVRMSERNKKLGMGYQHWDITDEWIRAECDRHLDDALIEELGLYGGKRRKNDGLLTMRVMYRAATFEMEKQKIQLENQKKQLENQKRQLENQKRQLQELQERIQQIQHSIPMQLVNRYQRAVDKLIRPGTCCRRYYELALSGIRVTLNEGWRSLFRRARARLTSRPLARKERHYDLQKFDDSMSKQCYICGAPYRLPDPETVVNLREAHLCTKCGGSRRTIDLAHILLEVVGSRARCLGEATDDLWKLKIYLLEYYGPIHAVLSNSPNFTCSEYWDDRQPGETRDNVRCEDVQNLTFPDASFDIVMDQDVFEHVANPEAGLREIHRVLKPGGYHIFTLPLRRHLAKSIVRARLEGDGIMHLLPAVYHGTKPAVYHGDGLLSTGSLVFTEFGSDLVETMEKIGFEVETYEDEHPEYPAGYNAVFVCRKK